MNGGTESRQKHRAGKKQLGCSTHAHQSQRQEHLNSPNDNRGQEANNERIGPDISRTGKYRI